MSTLPPLLTTLFTGHTVRLIDVAFVGPVTEEVHNRATGHITMSSHITIGLVYGQSLTHSIIEIDGYGITEQQQAQWDSKLNQANKDRDKLVGLWMAEILEGTYDED